VTRPLSPDTGEMLRLFLGSVTSVTAIAGTRIGLSLTGAQPAIRLHQVAEVPVGDEGGVTEARWTVECWGAGGGAVDDGTSGLLARTVRSALPDFVGVWGGARAAGATPGPVSRQDDPTTGRPRHIVEVAFLASP
jgi:hypothetical protein